LAAVESRLERALARSGRQRSEITLVAVSKKFSACSLLEAYEAGLREFGENYVQEFADKKPELHGMSDAKFHLIGHLQSNKARLAAELFDVVQTVDSAKLLGRLDAAAQALSKTLKITFEVKLGSEESKTGAEVAELPKLLDTAAQFPHLQASGLMTIPPWSEDPEASRPYFARLAELAAQRGLRDLSMGMSNDFEVAIEEGATIVRIGTALFGVRPKPQ
jgi:pyridoxal phosphate enzyme (YggS family)